MNAILSIPNPLPAILEQPFDGSGRRFRIQNFSLTMASVDRFNRLLNRLGRPEPLERDQLVTAARELCDHSLHDSSPPCIRERMRRIATVEQMVADPQWAPASDTITTAKTIVDYARGHDDLIPDWLPKVGRLDDAIVVDTAWPLLSGELDDYVDFCRLRAIEARLRGCSVAEFSFTRGDWEEARYGEAALVNHQREVREHSYLPASVARFYVH